MRPFPLPGSARGPSCSVIDRINRLVSEHEPLRARYQHIAIRVVELGLTGLDYPSKLDRRGEFIERHSVPANSVRVGS